MCISATFDLFSVRNFPKPPPERKAATPAIAPILPNVNGTRIEISIFSNKGRKTFVASSKTDEIPKAA